MALPRLDFFHIFEGTLTFFPMIFIVAKYKKTTTQLCTKTNYKNRQEKGQVAGQGLLYVVFDRFCLQLFGRKKQDTKIVTIPNNNRKIPKDWSQVKAWRGV